MGPGGSQEAAFGLRTSVPAGTYHVTCDGIIIGPVDVTFTLSWRRGPTDTSLAQWTTHWDPLPGGGYDAQAYEVDMAAPAIDWKAGDQLVFRYAAANTATPEAFIPNGDGRLAHGRIPSIALPQ
ncbi:MAG TPA: hypothetical protein VHN14_15610 [Kofleriaceae bacterium]|nr:hypothetical protein [Kofleriaceae bacterium]